MDDTRQPIHTINVNMVIIRTHKYPLYFYPPYKSIRLFAARLRLDGYKSAKYNVKTRSLTMSENDYTLFTLKYGY